MAKEKESTEVKEPVLSGVQVMCAAYGYGAAQATSLLAELKLSESDVQSAFKSGREALDKLINDATDKFIASQEKDKKPTPPAPAPTPAQ